MQVLSLLPNLTTAQAGAAPIGAGLTDSSPSPIESGSSSAGFRTVLQEAHAASTAGETAVNTSSDVTWTDAEGLTDSSLTLALNVAAVLVSQPPAGQIAASGLASDAVQQTKDSGSETTIAEDTETVSSSGRKFVPNLLQPLPEGPFSPPFAGAIAVGAMAPASDPLAGLQAASGRSPDPSSEAKTTGAGEAPPAFVKETASVEQSLPTPPPGTELPVSRPEQTASPAGDQSDGQAATQPLGNTDSHQAGKTAARTGLGQESMNPQTGMNRNERADSGHDYSGNQQPPEGQGRIIATGLAEGSKSQFSSELDSLHLHQETTEDSFRSSDHESLSALPLEQQQPYDGRATAPFQVQAAWSGQPAGLPTTSTSLASTLAADPLSRAAQLDREPSSVQTGRSVQFDLPSADLGQLRVRVVLADQTVHTHMVTDRPEVGQLLASRQDQLGAQLSASGLDMGRFHVQVDRDGANHAGQDRLFRTYDDASQRQSGHRQQDHQPDFTPGQERTGVLSLFA